MIPSVFLTITGYLSLFKLTLSSPELKSSCNVFLRFGATVLSNKSLSCAPFLAISIVFVIAVGRYLVLLASISASVYCLLGANDCISLTLGTNIRSTGFPFSTWPTNVGAGLSFILGGLPIPAPCIDIGLG